MVWSFWIEPERIVRWMGRTATVDPRPGGRIRVDYGYGDRDAAARFVELDPPRRLAFTWGWEDPAEAVRPAAASSRSTFPPMATARCFGCATPGCRDGERDSHLEGWEHFRPRLIEAVEADAAAEA